MGTGLQNCEIRLLIANPLSLLLQKTLTFAPPRPRHGPETNRGEMVEERTRSATSSRTEVTHSARKRGKEETQRDRDQAHGGAEWPESRVTTKVRGKSGSDLRPPCPPGLLFGSKGEGEPSADVGREGFPRGNLR